MNPNVSKFFNFNRSKHKSTFMRVSVHKLME